MATISECNHSQTGFFFALTMHIAPKEPTMGIFETLPKNIVILAATFGGNTSQSKIVNKSSAPFVQYFADDYLTPSC
jgi:hypothetical protein